jgi:hypothetical protein
MANDRCKDVQYIFSTQLGKNVPNNLEHSKMALLMDLRDELKLNNELQYRVLAVLERPNTTKIPHILARIDRRLAKKMPLK